MFEQIINFLVGVPWYWVLVITFLITLAENLFPPVPGDSVLLFAGTLIGLGVVGFPEMIIASTLGGSFGFAIMYWIGYGFERKIIESGKLKFLSKESLDKVEEWFRKYGYSVIVANRFLSGTRAVIGFFAGMSRINFTLTIIFATLSSLIWNSIILFFGAKFGDNWQLIDYYLSIYGKIIFPIVIIVIAVFLWRFFRKK